MTPGRRRDDRRPRIAYLSFSTGEYDARSFRMARSAIAAGYAVTVYSRWHAGQPPVEEHEGYRLVRVPYSWRLAVPILRGRAGRRIRREMAAAARAHAARSTGPDVAAAHGRPVATTAVGDGAGAAPEEAPGVPPGDVPGDVPGMATATAARVAVGTGRSLPERIARLPLRAARRAWRRGLRGFRHWRRVVWMFPLRPMGWASALDAYAEPADIWHGMWAGSLPALARMRARHGGRTIYDSRDVYMRSREFARLAWPLRPILAALERRWARAADRVLTVNEPYAGLLVEQLGIPRPPVVMNCLEAWTPPEPAPDLIREATGIPATTAIALYQGQFMSERGIEQAMDAILEVPGAVLVLLGYGDWAPRLKARSEEPPHRGRVFVLPAVSPDVLVDWTASSDVMVMAIQPTTPNHRFTTPQKLFESIAAGVPVVASDLPGMASIVRESGVGELCDPVSPASIAAAIRRVIERSPAERAAIRDHVLQVAHERYNWEAQLGTLFAMYRELAPPPIPDRAAAEPNARAT